MPGRIIIAALVVIIAALATPALAQDCGQPPDPRTNTAGYANWCSCMGGTYNYQTTACVGAHGPSTGGGRSTTASGDWGCYARARNGAWGNSWGFASESEARARAIAECQRQSRGQACGVGYCRTGTSAAQRPGPGGTRRAPVQTVQPTRTAYACSVCEQKLRNDLDRAWASQRGDSYVRLAIADYQNCKLKARPPCGGGDRLQRQVNACFGRAEAAFRSCLGRALGR